MFPNTYCVVEILETRICVSQVEDTQARRITVVSCKPTRRDYHAIAETILS